jgi:sugar O-acyltransferase (sialic acid O-acetyltransferase NeuD family)
MVSNLSSSEIIVIGGRPDGHGRVVLEVALQLAGTVVLGFLDDNPSPPELCGVPRLGPSEAWSTYLCTDAVRFHIAIGHNPTRRRIAQHILREGGQLASVIHPQAVVYPSVHVGMGCFVGAGVILCPGVVIGSNVIINHGAILEHDCRLGDYVNVSTGFVTGGRVTLEEGVFAGIGAKVIPDVTVRRWTYLGAGTVVTHDTQSHSLYVGVPARRVRALGNDDEPRTP